jgi:hypothetical protein
VTLVADADVPVPVIQALKAVRYDIIRYSEIDLPSTPDRALMEALLQSGGILLTRDTGIPSQAYLHEYGIHGLTIVLLRWKQQRARDWQEMVEAILRYGESWERTARETPSLISVSRSGSRGRPWYTLPPEVGNPAR